MTRRGLRCQYEMLRTLWTNEQSRALEIDILEALESEFGPMLEETKEEQVQHAAGWLMDNESDLTTRDVPESETLPGHVFQGLRICRCLGCGQRIAWRPSDGLQACSGRCYKQAFEAEVKESARVQKAIEDRNRRLKKEREEERNSVYRYTPKPYYVTLAIDPVAMSRVVDSLQRQLIEQHNLLTDFVKPHCVRGKWTVLEFSIRDTVLIRRSLHIILNGTGPGRAAWVLDVHSAEEAVNRMRGRIFSPDVGIPHAQ